MRDASFALPSLRPWPHVKRSIFVPNVLIVKARFGTRVDQRVVNISCDVEVTIDRAIAEFDLQNMEPFAVPNRRERGRFDRHALDM